MSTPYPPGQGGHNYPGGYGPPPGGGPGYGAPSGPQQPGYPNQGAPMPQNAPPPQPAPQQQPYPQQQYNQPYPVQPYPQQQYNQPYPQGNYSPYGGGPSSDDRTMGLIIHLGGILLGFLLPLVLYLMKKDESAWTRHHAAQAFNFQVTMWIGYVVSCVLIFVIIGLVLIPIIAITALVFSILAAVAANKGEWYRYPIAIPMLK